MVYRILFSSTYSPVEKILLLVAFLLSATLAICLHEFAHGFAAYKMGDPTAKLNGRLTINPLVHFEPIGLLMFLLVGFGFARPVPVDPYNFRDQRKGMLITAFAGVAANLLQAIVGFGMMIGFGYALVTASATVNSAVYYLMYFLYQFSLFWTLLNVVLIAFNLLPIFPLDGFRVVEALSRTENAYIRFMRRYGSFILIGIVVIGFFFDRIGIPQGDVFGTYLSTVQGWIMQLYFKIMGGLLG